MIEYKTNGERNMSRSSVDVVCLGELLIDMFPAEMGRRLAEVSAFRPKPGGAPANVAVGLARLGCNSAFVGKVGDDAFGHHLAAVLADIGVETRGMRFDPAARTTMAFIASPDPHRNEYLFYRNPGADTRLRAEELDEGLLGEIKVLHFGSLRLVEEPIRSAAIAAVEIAGLEGLVSLDVNYRPSLWPSPEAAKKAVMALLPQVDILKVNEEELLLLSGQEDPVNGGKALLEMGPKLIVMTLGAGGSYFATAQGNAFVPAFEVETIDATGCGDAFVAGLLSQLIAVKSETGFPSPEHMKGILRYANATGALTAQVKGVIPALPTAEAVESFLASHS